jgi:hypothetical protein
VRPGNKVASAAALAALVMVALPGLGGSRLPSPEQPIDAAAFRTDPVKADGDPDGLVIDSLDPAFRSAGFVTSGTAFVEPGASQAIPTKPPIRQPNAARGSTLKPPRYTLTGWATFYDYGTTAMRLPRGTVVVICGDGGCVERVINDYGPSAAHRPVRIADLYRPDFFRICGCPSWSGTTWVTVRVY